MTEVTVDDGEWRFLIDENLGPDIVAEVRRYGIDAEWVPDVLAFGADDLDDILPYCRETWTVLVTNNVRDFNASDLAPEDHAGIVVVHDKERPSADIAGELHRITVAYPSREAFRGFEIADDWSTD